MNVDKKPADAADNDRAFGPTEYRIEPAPDSRISQAIALMAVGALGMIVGVLGLLGLVRSDRK